jgi:hypothetical protein
MVSEMRVPSSSSSALVSLVGWSLQWTSCTRTDSDGLDLNALLDMGSGWIVGILVVEDSFPAEGIDESSSTCESQ